MKTAYPVSDDIPVRAARRALLGAYERVVLTADGKILLGREIVTDAQLSERLAQAKAADPTTKVVLQADKRALHEAVVQILDAARMAGLRVAIATDVRARS